MARPLSLRQRDALLATAPAPSARNFGPLVKYGPTVTPPRETQNRGGLSASLTPRRRVLAGEHVLSKMANFVISFFGLMDALQLDQDKLSRLLSAIENRLKVAS